ncbi:Aspartic protease 6 [Hypsizygus marmoreus]|uniref:Aspartic protease 6 n=1 Tax=Hypsizygus marmoreus TaxID=39966 RepID=A0A369IYM3_HYPMA|nr:Aspartic protease 6 [Hypsizygus marmoreus]
MRSLIPLSLLLTIFSTCPPPAFGIRLPFDVHITNSPNHLTRRSANLPVSNNGNAQYIGNITLGGVGARVLLDTGSSDLWVAFPKEQPQAKDVGKGVTLAYAVGQASGNVHTTTAQIQSYKVDDQAFLLVGNTSTFSSDIHAQGYDGLLGLGPNKGSVIRKKLDGDTGDTLLTHIWQQTQSEQSYITFLLDRKSDPTDPFTGQLTISELVPGFENITSMPKLDVDTVNRLLSSDQHWQALTDKNNGVIGPDGNAVTVDSIVPGAPDGQFVAVFDSGFTFSQVPREVSDAIYGRVRGAVYDVKDEIWTVPCGQLIQISLQFGGRTYPVHPLDTVDDNFHRLDAAGSRVCIGAFQPITSAFSLLGHYDMILGMSFLRNAYTLLDFGSWAAGKSADHPYIQLASVTDAAQARQDFIKVRLGGVDTTSDERWSLLPKEQMQHSPISEEEKKKKYQELVLSRWPYILTGCLVFVLLVVGYCVWRCCCCRKGAKKPTKKNKNKNMFATEPESTAYLPLQEPGSKGGLTPGGQDPSSSQYSLDSQYAMGGQYPPDARYSTANQYAHDPNYPEPKSPMRSQHPPDPHYPPPPQYSTGDHSPSPYGAHAA